MDFQPRHIERERRKRNDFVLCKIEFLRHGKHAVEQATMHDFDAFRVHLRAELRGIDHVSKIIGVQAHMGVYVIRRIE